MSILTFIVPVYNTQDYIGACLESILSQSLSDIDVVCIDDGSTDRSLSILNHYAKIDTRVKVITQNNEGSGPAREKGIAAAQGQYITFVDADDWVLPYFAHEAHKAFLSSNAKAVCFNTIRYDQCANNVVDTLDLTNTMLFKKSHNLQLDPWFSLKDVPGNDRLNAAWLGPWGKAYRTEFIRENHIGFGHGRPGQDLPFSVKALILAQKIYYIDKYLYCYRIRPDSAAHALYDKSAQPKNIKMVLNVLQEEGLEEEFSSDFTNMALDQLVYAYSHTPLEFQKKFKNEIRQSLGLQFLHLFETSLQPRAILKKTLSKNEAFSLKGIENIFSIKNSKIGDFKVKVVTVFGFSFLFAV